MNFSGDTTSNKTTIESSNITNTTEEIEPQSSLQFFRSEKDDNQVSFPTNVKYVSQNNSETAKRSEMTRKNKISDNELDDVINSATTNPPQVTTFSPSVLNISDAYINVNAATNDHRSSLHANEQQMQPQPHLHHQGQKTFDRGDSNVKADIISNVHSVLTDTKMAEKKIVNSSLKDLKGNSLSSSTSLQSSPILKYLHHAASEPIFGASIRQGIDNSMRNEPYKHGVSSDSETETNASQTSGSISSASLMPRRVSFPKSDRELVTGYLEPADPWEHVLLIESISEIAELYVSSCQKHCAKPLQAILDHLKIIELNKSLRQSALSLRSIKLTAADCEALEEVFKRIQYKSIDIASCELTENAASALFDMFEYYEATNELDISSNPDGMTSRGWQSCTYMISHSRALQALNAQGNPISKTSAENLGLALNTSNITTIKLEHCGLKGAPLHGLCFKIRSNRNLKELWLAHNDLDCFDAGSIAELLMANHYLQLIDISNNNIKDEGLQKIVKSLIIQSAELGRRRSLFQRSSAVDDDKSNRYLSSAQHDSTNHTQNNSTNDSDNEETNYRGESSCDSDTSLNEDTDDDAGNKKCNKDEQVEKNLTTKVGSGILDDIDDDDTEDTVKIVKCLQNSGQSMLDKLLSMNSDSSSEEAPSNISTDTIAACCSEEISISDDILDSNNSTKVSTINTLEDFSSTAKQMEIGEKVVNTILNNNMKTESLSEDDAKEQTSGVFETSTEESESLPASMISKAEKSHNSLQFQQTRALDVNKNNKFDDFEDTHSTDSAFESASEGDISRHLPDEFGRLSAFESTRIDDTKEVIETAVIATETTECFAKLCGNSGMNASTPTEKKTFHLPSVVSENLEDNLSTLSQTVSTVEEKPIATISIEADFHSNSTSPSPTLPSNGCGLRRSESNCMITQSCRIRSQSSDSLCSDNSLEGSSITSDNVNFSNKINENLTKNDTLTRQKQMDVPHESNEIPGGLKVLALWNTSLTKNSGVFISDLLATTISLELLNIGKNILSNDFIITIEDSLRQNKTMTTLGLQSAHLSRIGIETLSRILQFGGNSTLQRIDIRDNKIEVESLNTIAEALKSNTTVTQIDIDDEPKRLSVGNEAQLDYARVLENVRSMCSRNEKSQSEMCADKSSNAALAKRRTGYYMGSRKISLTCHTPTRAQTDTTNKLDVKSRKNGSRLRSPAPSPPTVSPSSSPVPSPSKSRFQVFRVAEVSPLTSPIPSPSTTSPALNKNNDQKSNTASIAAFPNSNNSNCSYESKTQSISLRASMSMMAGATSSTESVKRLSSSPRSRFHVMKIYEDPHIPITHRSLPPITAVQTTSKLSTVAAAEYVPTTAIIAPPQISTLAVSIEICTINNSIQKTETTLTDSKNAMLRCQPDNESWDLTNSNIVASVNCCPIVMFGDNNDITVTKNSINSERIKNELTTLAQLPASKEVTNLPELSVTNYTDSDYEKSSLNTDEELHTPSSQRNRKVSWIANPTYPASVDRLLSMFHNPGNLFHRSASPEAKSASIGNISTDEIALIDQQNPSALVSVRQFPWCKLGNEMVRPVTTAATITAAAAAAGIQQQQQHQLPQLQKSQEISETALITTTTSVVASEHPFSFIDAASKQLRDFGKQVFRQNLSFGNELNTNTNTTVFVDPTNFQQTISGCDTSSMPSDVKIEIKENISPEHTINEGTLNNLQKPCIGNEIKAGDVSLEESIGAASQNAISTFQGTPVDMVAASDNNSENSETLAKPIAVEEML